MKANVAVECCVAEAEHVTENIRILKIAPMDGAVFDWRAGQYASFQFSGCEPRDFSIANTSDVGLIELHVRRSGSGGASDAICDDVKVGDAVSVDGPYGASYFRERHQGPIVAIAGGTGLAPMKSIVEGARSAGFKKDIHLYYGVRDASEIYLSGTLLGSRVSIQIFGLLQWLQIRRTIPVGGVVSSVRRWLRIFNYYMVIKFIWLAPLRWLIRAERC